MKTSRSTHCRNILSLLTAIGALAILIPFGVRANGTAYYFDVNGTTAGFGSPSGNYTNNNAWWSTDATGVAAPAALSSGRQMTFGAAASDFNGNTFTLNLTNINWNGLLINSTNANITFVGTGNGYISGACTWTVPSGSTLTDAVLFNTFGLNFNNQNITLNGGGTINFNSCVGYNDTANVVENMPGGTVNFNYGWTAGTGNQATFNLQAGTLNFATAASANAMNGLHSGKYFTLSGGTIDNTSGSPMSLGTGAGTPIIQGDFVFNGSSDLNVGPAGEYFSAGIHQITVNAHTLTFGGPVTSAPGGGFTLLGGGKLALTAANTYSGDTILSGGTLDLKNQNAAQNSTVTLSGGTLVLDSSVSANAFTFGGLAANASGVGYDLALQNSAASPVTLTVGGNGVSTTYAGVLSGAGSLTKSGAGTLTLSAANTYTGNTTINAGSLDLSNQNAVQASTLTMSGGTAALVFGSSVSGNAFNVGGLASSASGPGYDIILQNNASAAIALAVGGNNASSTYAGTLSDAGLASSLTKIGTGTLSLSGTNTYSGATTINNGQLAGVVGGSCSNSAVTVAATTGNTAALDVSITDNTRQWTCPSLTINNGGTASGLQFNFGALVTPSSTIAPLNITGGVTFSTTPFVAIVAANLPVTTGNGYPLMTWGSGPAPSLPSLALPSRITGSLAIVGNTLYLQITGSTEPLSWTGGSGIWDINNSANIIWKDVTSATTYYQQGASGDSVVFDNTLGSGGTVTLNTNVLPASVAVNNPSADYAIIGYGAIKGATTLNKSGAHALTLATTNTYNGGTTLSAGQLNINNGGASAANSAIGNGPLTIAGTSTIDNTGAADVTLLPVIAENWNADFTYAGSAHNLNLGSGAISLGGNRQVTVAANTLTVPGVISDSGLAYSLTKAGGGTLTLQSANTYSGATTISAGVVNANNAGSLGTSGFTTNNGTLNLTAGAVNYAGLANALAGTGTVNITLGTGSAATSLNGDNSGFSGTLNVGINAPAGAGKMQLNGVLGSGASVNVLTNATVYVTGVNQPAAIMLYGGATGENLGQLRLDAGANWSGPVILAGNQTGNFQGIIGGNSGVATISGVISQTGGNWLLSKSGSGNVALSGTNTYAGGLLVEQGAVTLYNDQSHATGGLAVGTDNYNSCTLNLGDTSQSFPTLVRVAAGNAVQIGAVQTGNTGYEVLNATGASGNPTMTTNDGSLFLGRNSAMNIGSDALWVQSGPVNLQPFGGYSPTLNVYNGGTFVYTGTNGIQLTENPGTSGPSTVSIGSPSSSGGVFITGQPFNYNSGSGTGTGIGRVTMAGGGTLVLATNLPQLTTGDVSGQFLLGNGGGVIDVSNYNTTLSVGIANISGQSGGLTKAGMGALKLTGTNTYAGDTTVNAGALDVANPLALKNSTLTMTGGQVVFDAVVGNALSVGGLAASASGPGYDLALTNSAGVAISLTVGTNINVNNTYAGVLSGPGSLTQAGDGILNLTGANTYTGNTTIRTGTLEIGQPTIATNSTVTVANGAVLQLDFAVTNTVAALVLDGTNQAPGVYNNTSSAPYITGAGSLQVVPGIATNPTNITFSISGNTLHLSWPADHLGWMVQSNSVNLALPGDWYDISNTISGTNYSITIDATTPNVFYRLRKP
ncbi:MAG: autotransporter-associated beta strand repeat-containing protein [Verrucomicrobiota bacterium]